MKGFDQLRSPAFRLGLRLPPPIVEEVGIVPEPDDGRS